MNWLLCYPVLAWRLIRAPRADLILIGYPGILDVFIATPIARMRRMPVIWDVFLSVYDTVCEDRRLLRADGLAGRCLRWLEGAALRRVDLAFMDTQAHARRVETLFDLKEGQCDSVWVGVESRHFSRVPTSGRVTSRSTRVLFYGQFIPLHGVETIIHAARVLRNEDVDWQLVGRGQQSENIRRMLTEDPLPRLHWTDWMEYSRLQQLIADADLCLGIFGTSAKAASVIPNKVFQIVSTGRPLVTRDSPAIRELISPSPSCVYLVQAGNAEALAEAVLAHHRILRDQMTVGPCHAAITDKIDSRAIGRQFVDMLYRRKIVR